jgi:hypothetical protein
MAMAPPEGPDFLLLPPFFVAVGLRSSWAGSPPPPWPLGRLARCTQETVTDKEGEPAASYVSTDVCSQSVKAAESAEVDEGPPDAGEDVRSIVRRTNAAAGTRVERQATMTSTAGRTLTPWRGERGGRSAH